MGRKTAAALQQWRTVPWLSSESRMTGRAEVFRREMICMTDTEPLLRATLEARLRGENAPIELPGAMLAGIDLRGADLAAANLQQADLCGADLAGAHLCRANLQGANLVGAILDGADLTDADLRGADLAGARIDDAVLTHARLEGACLAAVLGDPLSFSEAQMDRHTVQLSQFTMRDVAQLVVRGALVTEHQSVPPSLAPRLRSLPPSVRLQPLALVTSWDAPLCAASPSTDQEPQAPACALDGEGGQPASSSQGAPVSALSLSVSRPSPRELHGQVPSSVPVIAPPSSLPFSIPPHSPGQYPSIIPALRKAEVSARIELAAQDEAHPHSIRVFRNLTALIESAQVEQHPPLSLRPAIPKLQKLQSGEFQFPEVGETYLGVTVSEKLPLGTTCQCFVGTDQDGRRVVLRIFNPDCEGAALQLPAFQRGLRALQRLQPLRDEGLRVAPVLAVAADQTAFVVPCYSGKSAKELVEARLSLEQGLDVFVGLSRTVARMHSEGVMIRSLKPENVLVAGLELIVAEPDMVHLPTLAQYHGNVAGYAAYAAQEEILGVGTRSPSADVFSLGKMLEFFLTGQEPLAPIGSPRLVTELSHVPEGLLKIVLRATAKEPQERYQSVDEFMTEVELFRREGNRAELRARLRPETLPRLQLPAFSTGPKLVEVEKVVEEQKARFKPSPQLEPEVVTRTRAFEIVVGLLASVGGLTLLVLLILAPRSVDVMTRLEPYLAGAMGLAVLLAPRPLHRPWLTRVALWAALSMASEVFSAARAAASDVSAAASRALSPARSVARSARAAASSAAARVRAAAASAPSEMAVPVWSTVSAADWRARSAAAEASSASWREVAVSWQAANVRAPAASRVRVVFFMSKASWGFGTHAVLAGNGECGVQSRARLRLPFNKPGKRA